MSKVKSLNVVIIVFIFAVVVFVRIYFNMYFEEINYKVCCVNKMKEDYMQDNDLKNAFTYINIYLDKISIEKGISKCEVLAFDGVVCVDNEYIRDNELVKCLGIICEKYNYLQNEIYLIVYNDCDIFYVFEESEYIFVYSDLSKPSISEINDQDKYIRFNLDNNMYLFVKIRYYD